VFPVTCAATGTAYGGSAIGSHMGTPLVQGQPERNRERHALAQVRGFGVSSCSYGATRNRPRSSPFKVDYPLNEWYSS
jgi:hypothetical protein